jgi:hypothetical protein
VKIVQQSWYWLHLAGSAWLWLARVTCGGVFVGSMAYEWTHWPNGSPVLGPLGMIWYGFVNGENLALCTISLAMLFAFLIKPHTITAAISLLGMVNWLFWGILAQGVGC